MNDDRIVCADCKSFRRGRCTVADQHKLVGVWGFIAALVEIPTRCIFFAPLAGADDPRSGAERFPWLVENYQSVSKERRRVFYAHAQRGLERAKAALS